MSVAVRPKLFELLKQKNRCVSVYISVTELCVIYFYKGKLITFEKMSNILQSHENSTRMDVNNGG